ncbi:MAG: molybdopterin converting factor subunit 1 [Rhodobacteraceae bacterium]|nr:molybdopterin converting factor subunit 1 [Paracoccaceae bacterium]
MTLRVLYFAWVRERIGIPDEEIETTAATVRAFLGELAEREERYHRVFANPEALRVAVDQRLCDLDSPLADASEIAIFPPMTGG